MTVYMKEPQTPAIACIIWMHGLGANAQDMAGLAEQLPLTVPVRHVFMDAPFRAVTINQGMSMRAWYDIVGAALTDREDREGVLASDELIQEVIATQRADGFEAHQIFLAGFSQGGAMALFSGVRHDKPLAGIITLSAYLPLARECKVHLDKSTPIFVASGRFDPIVRPDWTGQSVTWLREQGFLHISTHDYPMEHSVCLDELRDLAKWIEERV